MRWFIVFLIVANIILFVWVKQQSRPAPDSSALPPPDIGHLRLSNEVDGESPVVTVATPFDEAGEFEPVKPELPDEVAVLDDDAGSSMSGAAAARADAAVLVEEPRSADSAAPATPPAQERMAEVTPEVVRPTERDATLTAGVVDAEPVAPLSESPQASSEAEEDSSVVASPAPAAEQSADAGSGLPEDVVEDQVPAAQAGVAEPGEAMQDAGPPVVIAVCARVGPFEPADAERLVANLPSDTELLSDVSEEYSRIDRYYVLIPPLASRAAGRQMIKRLAEAGFTDTWLFPSGEYRNAISLGYFSRASGARRHAANIAQKGFDTEVREKASVRQRRWLLLKNAEGEDPGSRLTLPAGVDTEPQTCP